MAIYACGVLAAIVCGYLIFATTFSRSAKLKAASVNVLGFRAPLGAFIAAWGGIAMLTSAPFDNWWHAAYGLDVKIVSPPHTLLILGIRAVAVGVLFLILAAMNRADSARNSNSYKSLQRLFLYTGGLIVVGQMFFLLEYTWDVELHSATAYIAMAIALPVVFAMLSQASRHPGLQPGPPLSIWSLPSARSSSFRSSQPRPNSARSTFRSPTWCPAISHPLFLPALALDLLWQRTRDWKPWKVALLSGFLFIAVLVVVEWPFASFLMSKASENRFFGTIYFDYNSRPDGEDRLRHFFHPDYGLTLTFGLLRAAIYGSIGTWIGLSFGRWMRGVQR